MLDIIRVSLVYIVMFINWKRWKVLFCIERVKSIGKSIFVDFGMY